MRETPPLVSLIIPAYNRAAFLDETIQSLLDQDYPRKEIIVLDDGSTDGTVQVLERYAQHIRWESHANMGEALTVNRGFELARGEIISVVNSDDPLLPGAVSAAAAALQAEPAVLVVYGSWQKIGPDSQPLALMEPPDYDYLYMVRYQTCVVGPGAFVRRRALELAGGRDPQFRYMSDFDLWLRIGRFGPIRRLPQTLATFRVHPDSASVTRRSRAMGDECIRLVDKYFSLPGLSPEVLALRGEARSWAHYVAANLSGGDWWAIKGHQMMFALLHPSNLFQAVRRTQYEAPIAKPGFLPRPFQRIARRLFGPQPANKP